MTARPLLPRRGGRPRREALNHSVEGCTFFVGRLALTAMAKKYRSPSAPTAAAAAAPARLAEEYGGYALWHTRPNGGLEVATVRDGCLYRHLVHDDGTTSVIDYQRHQPSHHWAVPMSYAGFGFCALTLIGMIGGALSVEAGFLLFLGGMAVMGIGTVVNALDMDVAKRLNRRPETAGEWHEPSRLGGWAPRTLAQLAAVEQLADKHNGVARVRDASDEAVEVLVRRWGLPRHYLVDVSGRLERAGPTPQRTDSTPWREIRTIEEDND